MAELQKKSETVPDTPDVTDYATERRNVVLTVAVLSAWVFFVLAVVSRSTAVSLSDDALSLQYVAPLLFVILVSIIFLVIFCLPSTLTGEGEDVQGPVIIDHDGCVNPVSSVDVT